MKKGLLLVLLALSFIVGCTKVNDNQDPQPPKNPLRLLIANEGQFGYGTASLTGVDEKGFVKQDLFRNKNNRTIGDVAQSVAHINNKIYVTLNNSRKIEVMDDVTFESIATIPTPYGSIPTYICDLGNNKAAVTEKGRDGRMLIIDTKTDKIIGEVPSVGSANQMLRHGNKLFFGGFDLRVLDLDNMTEGARRFIRYNGDLIQTTSDSKIVADKNNNIWVLHLGLLDPNKLVCIDPKTEEVIKVVTLPNSMIGTYDRLDISPDGTKLYFSGRINYEPVILSININDTEAPTKSLFDLKGRVPAGTTLYNMAVSKEGTIFVSSVTFGSLARGTITEFSTTGEKIQAFEAGIFSQYIHFF